MEKMKPGVCFDMYFMVTLLPWSTANVDSEVIKEATTSTGLHYCRLLRLTDRLILAQGRSTSEAR